MSKTTEGISVKLNSIPRNFIVTSRLRRQR
jgi:hypothetical protein